MQYSSIEVPCFVVSLCMASLSLYSTATAVYVPHVHSTNCPSEQGECGEGHQ